MPSPTNRSLTVAARYAGVNVEVEEYDVRTIR